MNELVKDHCSKCDGFGIIPYYAGIKNGVCFQCKGIKTRTEKRAEYDRKKREEKKKDLDLIAREEKQRQEIKAVRDRMKKINEKYIPDLKEMLLEIPVNDHEGLDFLKRQLKRYKEELEDLEYKDESLHYDWPR